VKLKTHISTGLLLGGIVAYLLDCKPTAWDVLVYASAIAAGNVFLDALGHTWVSRRGRRVPVRNRLHSPLGVLLVSTIAAAPLLYEGEYRLALGVYAALYLHLLEDMLTEGGVRIAGRRRRIAHVSYDDPIANRLAVLSFIALSLTPALQAIKGGPTSPVSLYWLLSLAYALRALL